LTKKFIDEENPSSPPFKKGRNKGRKSDNFFPTFLQPYALSLPPFFPKEILNPFPV
jgi:hypothetical protein